jgi:hypothetical protein
LIGCPTPGRLNVAPGPGSPQDKSRRPAGSLSESVTLTAVVPPGRVRGGPHPRAPLRAHRPVIPRHKKSLWISQFQSAKERDSLVLEIREPDVVSGQANGDRCEQYFGARIDGHEFSRPKKPDGGGTFYAFGEYYDSPDRWEGSEGAKHMVILCYKGINWFTCF